MKVKNIKEWSEAASLPVGTVFTINGETFTMGTVSHGVRHATHGPREDEKEGHALRKYPRRCPIPAAIGGLAVMFGESEAVEAAISKWQYDSSNKSTTEITGEIDKGGDYDPNNLPALIPSIYSPSVRKELSKKDADTVAAIRAKCAAKSKGLSALPPFGGIQLADDSDDFAVIRWNNARIAADDFGLNS